MKRFCNGLFAMMLGLGATMFNGCPLDIWEDCFGEDTISRAEYEELGALEQLFYEENDCDRYQPRF